MGFNTRDRLFDAACRERMRQVRRLDEHGLALHLIVTGARAFNDRCFVARVLDRIHRERGIACLRYGHAVRATAFADRWAQSRFCRVAWVAPRALLHQPAHGVLAFDGPDEFVHRARQAGYAVWRVAPRLSAFPGADR